MKDYHINIFFSDEDGLYIADIPDLPGCSAMGGSPLQALEELRIAKETWLEVAAKKKKEVPSPQYRPAIYQVPIY